MSGHSYTETCPKCKGTMDGYYDSKDAESNNEICWTCGFKRYMGWTEIQMNKDELINERLELEIDKFEYEEYLEEMKEEQREPLSFEEWTKVQVFGGVI